MLDGDHYRTQELVSQLMTNAQMNHSLDLIEKLKPKLYIGIQNDFRYSLENGIIDVGGETLHQAVMAFDRAFYNLKK